MFCPKNACPSLQKLSSNVGRFGEMSKTSDSPLQVVKACLGKVTLLVLFFLPILYSLPKQRFSMLKVALDSKDIANCQSELGGNLVHMAYGCSEMRHKGLIVGMIITGGILVDRESKN